MRVTEAFDISALCMMPALITFLAGIIIVLFAAGRGISRREVGIFAVTGILVSLGILPRIVGAILANHGSAIEIPFFFTALSFFVFPLAGHLLHAVRTGRGVILSIMVLYAAMACMVALSFFAGDTVESAAGWIALCAGLSSVFSGLSSHRPAADEQRCSRTVTTVTAGTALLLSAVVLDVFLEPAYAPLSFAFIPLIITACGIFYQDRPRINTYMKRQLLSRILRIILLVIYCLAALLICLLLREYRIDFIVSRVIPYGIPPLLSFISAVFLSLFVLGMEKNRTESLTFSLICFCYASLNLDILLVGIVPDMATALMISRIDHFFLALIMLGANLHLIFLITGKKNQWWLVYLAYLIGLVMAPLTQTSWYFQGMFTYYWGFFAKKALLYDIMSTLWLSALLYSIFLLFSTFKREESNQKRVLRNVLIAFLILSSLSLTNTPAIYGSEIYPLGNFIFIPLIFLAYSLFKFNLGIALQYVRAMLFWTGLVALLMGIGLVPLLVFHDKTAALPGGILLIALLYAPLRSVWNSVLNLFIRKTSDVLNDRYREFTASLSHIKHLDELHAMVRSWIFDVFDTLSCASVFHARQGEFFTGWTTINDRAAGLFGKHENHQDGDVSIVLEKNNGLIELLSGTRGLLTRKMLSRTGAGDLFKGVDFLSLKDAEIILPVFAHDRLAAVFFIGGKVDGSRYTAQEAEILTNMSLFLGPHVENAQLLEDLEHEVDVRTMDLNEALTEAMIKEKQIIERNTFIERQKRISEVLLETSSGIHNMKGLEELFGYTLAQLKSLFPDLRGAIILEGPNRGLLEASAFVGLSSAQQKVILDTRGVMAQPDIDAVLKREMEHIGNHGDESSTASGWNVFPLRGRGNKTAGYIILNGKDIGGPSSETIDLFIAQISAVVQNRLLLIHLERLASTDGLTGIYNRTFLDRELKKAIRHSRQFRNIWFSVMAVDVNGLKQINDTYGHSEGDSAIVTVAELLKSVCRETDIVSRVGGDEFSVLMPSTNRVQAEILLKRIRERGKDLQVIVKNSSGISIPVPIRISIGLASSDEYDPEDVVKVADDIMYADKKRYYAEQAATLSSMP